MSYETIQLELRGAVGLITLNRPASLNALTSEVGQEFKKQRLARSASAEREAVVITGWSSILCRR